jgi:hypothetical protein
LSPYRTGIKGTKFYLIKYEKKTAETNLTWVIGNWGNRYLIFMLLRIVWHYIEIEESPTLHLHRVITGSFQSHLPISELPLWRSVVDQDSWDSYVFRPPGSGSVIILYGSGSFYQLTKKVRKALMSTILWFLLDFLSMKTDEKCIQK